MTKQSDMFDAPAMIPPKVAAKIAAKKRASGALTKNGKFRPSVAQIRRVEAIRRKTPF